MKMPIEWHERCLKSEKESLIRKAQQLATVKAEYDRLAKESLIRKAQQLATVKAEYDRLAMVCKAHEDKIAEAKRHCLDGFDEDRFMKPRPKVSTECKPA